MATKVIKAMEDIPGLSESEVQGFLNSSKIPLHLATINDDGSPVIHPIWYLYENGKLYLYTGRDALKARNIKRTKKAYFSVDTSTDPPKGVKGKASASFLSDLSDSVRIAQAIILKYTSADNPYIQSATKEIQSAESVVIELTPQYYSTWDYEKLGQS